MSQNLNLALELLGIGMVTVFVVLLLVVFIGNSIILFVNRFMPDEEKVVSPSTLQTTTSALTQTNIERNKTAAIVSVVQIVTKGKGKIVKIEKI
jgi:oxaloacetate decarboxylase (Na+ extruding) subunit gamma